jgi:hypothetical protein
MINNTTEAKSRQTSGGKKQWKIKDILRKCDMQYKTEMQATLGKDVEAENKTPYNKL